MLHVLCKQGYKSRPLAIFSIANIGRGFVGPI